MQQVTTASELIDAFGGTTETARKYGVLPSAVSNWRKTGFPPRLHLKVSRDAEAAEITLPSNFFEAQGAAA